MNLTKTERDDWLALLHAWLPVPDFQDALDRLEAAQENYLLTDPRAGFYRDAFAALQFVTLVSADQVRLVGEERPDFEIDISGTIQIFEVTEADTPGRKRGAEVQDRRKRRAPGQPFVEDFPAKEWLTPEIADLALRAAAEKKNRGVYDPSWSLVILLKGLSQDK